MQARRLSELVRRDLPSDPSITGVTADSRKVRPGYLFAALSGSQADGRAFIPAALGAGAAAVLADETTPDQAAPVVRVGDVRRVYALASRAFYGAQPEAAVAVTGTNGKTSVANFCRQIFGSLGLKAASIGTLGVRVGEEQLTPPGLTTPDAADLAALLAELARGGVKRLALEASSHGIEQRRLDGVTLTAAGFTNLSQDHLDYHGSMEAYLDAKLRLFERLVPRGGKAVLNADSDVYGSVAATAIAAGQTIISVGERAQHLRLMRREPTREGQRLSIQAFGRSSEVLLPLAGAFQASNALVAAGLCIATGEPYEPVLCALESLQGAPGRLERIGRAAAGGEAFVDYAHTPDGLATALVSLRPHTKGRLMVVFGAGGDRDRGKRSLMGRAASRAADIVVVTDDNPRGEDPAAIRAAVLKGAKGAVEIADRREAIRYAVSLLREGDVLVVAGKGHEQGQTIGTKVHPFDDANEIRAALDLARG